MEAANPLCRLLLLAVGLAAVIGCRSDALVAKARGQLPPESLAVMKSSFRCQQDSGNSKIN